MNALTFKDFATDQEVRWCPGCGDYAILKSVHKALAEGGSVPEKNSICLRHRLFLAAALLRKYLWFPHHTRPRTRICHRRKAGEPGTGSVGCHRRW